MNRQIARSIESMERVLQEKDPNLRLYIDKFEGCILTTRDKNMFTPMYEIADWVQYLTNQAHSRHPSSDLKKLHESFFRLWESFISELTVTR